MNLCSPYLLPGVLWEGVLEVGNALFHGFVL